MPTGACGCGYFRACRLPEGFGGRPRGANVLDVDVVVGVDVGVWD